MANQASFDVQWAPPARADVEAIIDYISRERPATAASVLDAILRTAASLRMMPQRGRTVPELAEAGIQAYRKLVIPPWRIYRIEGKTALFVAVLDGRRSLADILLGRAMRH